VYLVQRVLFVYHSCLSKLRINECGEAWANAVIHNTQEIRNSSIQLEYRWVAGHSGIDGNEVADVYAKDADVLENEERLPSRDNRCTSLSHMRKM
jgi:ribonuclease HI